MLKYRKYITAATLSIGLYILYSIVFKKPIDPLIGGSIAGVVIFILSTRDLKKIKKEFLTMRYQVAEYASDKDVDKFIKAHTKFIEEASDESVKSMARLNLAAAYADKNDFENSKKVLNEIALDDFGKKNYVNAALNKILIFYRINDFESGDKLFDSINEKAEKNKKDPLFIITDAIRNYRGKEEGLRILSELNMRDGIEPYRNLIQVAKLIVKKGEVCADL